MDRRLLYIQPDPRYEPPDPKGKPPGWLRTIWGGLSSVAGYEPILQDLLDVRAFNERVRGIRDMVARVEEQVGDLLRDALAQVPGFDLAAALPADVPKERLEELRDRVHQGARTAAGFLGPHAEPKAQHDLQVRFLQAFDLGYTWRRVRFVIQAVNEMYGEAAAGERHPDRRNLDTAKRRLYAQALRLGGVIRGDLYATFRDLTADWSAQTRRRVVVRYLGFPFWDALIYPLRRLSDVGELDEVEVVRVSPAEAVALAAPGTS